MAQKEKMRAALTPVAESPENSEPQEYEVKDAADTLMKAEEIKKNKKLMPHVHKHLNKKFQSLKDLKRLAVEKDMAPAGKDSDEDGM